MRFINADAGSGVTGSTWSALFAHTSPSLSIAATVAIALATASAGVHHSLHRSPIRMSEVHPPTHVANASAIVPSPSHPTPSKERGPMFPGRYTHTGTPHDSAVAHTSISVTHLACAYPCHVPPCTSAVSYPPAAASDASASPPPVADSDQVSHESAGGWRAERGKNRAGRHVVHRDRTRAKARQSKRFTSGSHVAGRHGRVRSRRADHAGGVHDDVDGAAKRACSSSDSPNFRCAASPAMTRTRESKVFEGKAFSSSRACAVPALAPRTRQNKTASGAIRARISCIRHRPRSPVAPVRKTPLARPSDEPFSTTASAPSRLHRNTRHFQTLPEASRPPARPTSRPRSPSPLAQPPRTYPPS